MELFVDRGAKSRVTELGERQVWKERDWCQQVPATSGPTVELRDVAHELVGRFHCLTDILFLSDLGVDAEVIFGELGIYLNAILFRYPFQNQALISLRIT